MSQSIWILSLVSHSAPEVTWVKNGNQVVFLLLLPLATLVQRNSLFLTKRMGLYGRGSCIINCPLFLLSKSRKKTHLKNQALRHLVGPTSNAQTHRAPEDQEQLIFSFPSYTWWPEQEPWPETQYLRTPLCMFPSWALFSDIPALT